MTLKTVAVVMLALAATASGCDAPQEQKEWGARKGGLNLPPKEGSERERKEAEAAAAAARDASDQKAAEERAFEDRKGGLNLSPKGDKKPQN